MRKLATGLLGMVALLAACRGGGNAGAGGGGGNAGGNGGAGGSTGGSGGAGASSAVPIVDLALDGQCPEGSKPPDNGVSPGNDLHKVTLSDYPDAVCNDGSPALMYVRRAASQAASTEWVIHLQAGGSCQSWEVCRDRWCSFDTNYNAAKMSSKFAPEVANGGGLLARGGGNAFGEANQVYVYYCSSDQWSGQRDDHVFDDPAGEGPSFRVHFRGFSIIEAVNDALQKGAKSDDGVETMPKLTDATRILFAGSSAGSSGQTHALDWWAQQYPNAETYGFFDASTDPYPEDIPDAALGATLASFLPERYQETFVETWNSHLDESCLAAHPGEEAYICSLGSFVRLNHITTPFFVRHDLRDPVSYKALGEAGLAENDFAEALELTMARYKTLLSDALEKDQMTRAPGIHVSNCAQHIVALNPLWFGIGANPATVDLPNGMPITVHDALAAWIGGADVKAIDTHPSTASKCAMTTDEQ
jgi:hypothetical protein